MGLSGWAKERIYNVMGRGAGGSLATLLDATDGTATASKAVILDSSKGIATITSASFTTLDAGAITGSDASLGITGKLGSESVGGSVVVVAGAAAGGDYTGGAVQGQAGAGSGTGTGGQVLFSAGGSGTGATGNGGSVGFVGGDAYSTNGTGGAYAAAGGAGTGTGPGGGVTITAGSAGGSGDGGSVAVSPAVSDSGVEGVIRLVGVRANKQAAPGAVTDAETLAVGEMLGGLVTGTQSSGTTNAITLPTGTVMDAALPAAFAVNDSFDFTFINLSAAAADTYTLTADTGFTIVGQAIVESIHASALSIASGTFRCRKTAANTFVAYRIG